MVPCSILHRQYQKNVVFISSWKNSFSFSFPLWWAEQPPCTACCTDPFPLPSWPWGSSHGHFHTKTQYLNSPEPLLSHTPTPLHLAVFKDVQLAISCVQWLETAMSSCWWLNCHPAPHFQTLTPSFLNLNYWFFPKSAGTNSSLSLTAKWVFQHFCP